MLIISRKESESIVIPEIGLTIEILKTSGGGVKIGVQAPRDVKILRGELHEKALVSPAQDSATMVAEPQETYCTSS